VVGATTLLVSKLNKAATQYYRDDVTMKALLKAKEALIGYAVSYPDNPSNNNPNAGPGVLPCPDRNNDGDLQFSDGEFSCSIAGGTFLGRLPWRYMGIDEIRDSSGQALWYALSDNFRIPASSFRVVNSDTAGELTLDSDGNGTGEDEDIVAIIIAPLEPVCNQDRTGLDIHSGNYVDETNYLEDVNADTSNPDFVTEGTTQNCNDHITFNDQIVAITRRELMTAVEKRVMGEVANVLEQRYQVLDNLSNGNGRFPWLSPFVDPRRTASVTGHVDSGSPPDSLGTQLNDNSQNFIASGVDVDDVIINLTDNSAGVINRVTKQTIRAILTGGTENRFDMNDRYLIPRVAGQTESNSTLTLTDSTKDFQALGVREGDLVQNFSDSSFGIVRSVSQDSLTVASLFGGTNNTFSNGDIYWIPRLNGSGAGIYPSPLDNGVREGLLSFHEEGEAFRSSFSVSVNLNSGGTICSQLDPLVSGDYITSLQNSLTNNNFSIGVNEGVCVWTTEEEVYCSAIVDHSETSNNQDSTSKPPCDTSSPQDRAPDEIVRREYVLNFTGTASVNNTNGQLTRDVSLSLPPQPPGSNFLVRIRDLDSSNTVLGEVTISATTSSDSVTVNGIFYDLADLSGLADAGSSGTQLVDGNIDFIEREVQPGDWVQNLRNNAFGRVVSVDNTTLTVETKGSPSLSFGSGDRYRIFHTLPPWFQQNNWHQLYLVAISGEEIPGGSGGCSSSETNCLNVQGKVKPNEMQAVVISAGSMLGGQDRSSVTISAGDFFEDDNSSQQDDSFTTFPVSSQPQPFPPHLNRFNDQVRIVNHD